MAVEPEASAVGSSLGVAGIIGGLFSLLTLLTTWLAKRHDDKVKEDATMVSQQNEIIERMNRVAERREVEFKELERRVNVLIAANHYLELYIVQKGLTLPPPFNPDTPGSTLFPALKEGPK